MAKIDRFMIAPINSGLQNDLKPWLIPDDAFQELNNAYVFRGRVRKRFGSRLMRGSTQPDEGFEQLQSRLRVFIENTDGAGNSASNAPGIIWKQGQMFSVGDQFFTVVDAGVAQPMLISGAATLATFDTTNGAYVINGAAINTPVYFYPALPVMGLINYEQATINDELIFAFDTQFAYQFTVNGWARLGVMQWSGTNSDFFWGYNWRGVFNYETYLFVTNYVVADGIQYYNPNGMALWNKISPVINNTQILLTGKIVIPFKDRLVVLNTIEGDQGDVFIPGMDQATDGGGNFDQTMAGTYVLGQQFVVGSTVYTIIDDTPMMLTDLGVAAYPGTKTPPTAQFNFSSGNLVITGNNNNINTIVYFFDGTNASTATYSNRCRYSLNGDPTRANGWLETFPGLGGFVDAPTKEAIVTAQFLKDRLIVYFESSTWELVYTGNQVLPFVWQQINTELGAESTFSQVPFDKFVLGVGNVGIHACNGSNVDRIDDKIPNAVFDIHNENNSVTRVYGIRDYYVEMVYWSFPDVLRSADFPYNNRVLIYNYKNGSWAFNDDSITAFGYYQAAANEGNTWQSNPDTWATSNEEWGTGSAPLQAKFRSVLAGNQEGFVFIVSPETSHNAPALQITNMTIANGVITITCYDHNLKEGFADGDLGVAQGDYILIENVIGIAGFTSNPSPIYPVSTVMDKNTFTIVEPNAMGVYVGGGTIARVSNIEIQTKQYNFYADQGRNALINKVDFLVDKTTNGEITIDYSISSSGESQLVQGSQAGSILGNGILDTKPYALVPFEATQDRLWHPIYPMADGECIQLNMYFTAPQIVDSRISLSDFELHGMVFYTSVSSSRFQ